MTEVLSQGIFKMTLSDCYKKLLFYESKPQLKIENNNNSILVKSKEDLDLNGEKYPIKIVVLGPKKSGKSFVIQSINRSYKINDKDIKFYEIPSKPELEANIIGKALVIIYVVNAFGFIEQKEIDRLYKSKMSHTQLIVVFNMHTVITLDLGLAVNEDLKSSRCLQLIKEDILPIAYCNTEKDNTSYYVLYNSEITPGNELAFQSIGDFIANTITQAFIYIENEKKGQLKDQLKPEYCYYTDIQQSQFVIEIALCGGVKDLELQMKLDSITALITFTINGKWLRLIDDNENNKDNYIFFKVEFTVSYEIASIKNFKPITKYEYKEGIVKFSIDALDRRYQAIEAKFIPSEKPKAKAQA